MFSVAYVYANHTEASAAVAAERADPISVNSFLNAVTLLSFLKITALYFPTLQKKMSIS